MRLSVDPPVVVAVREALVEALAVDTRPTGYDDPWRQAALRDGVERAVAEAGYALSPRNTRGATRA